MAVEPGLEFMQCQAWSSLRAWRLSASWGHLSMVPQKARQYDTARLKGVLKSAHTMPRVTLMIQKKIRSCLPSLLSLLDVDGKSNSDQTHSCPRDWRLSRQSFVPN